MTYTIWIEDSGESLENLNSEINLKRFNKVFGFNLQPWFYVDYGHDSISEMIGYKEEVKGVFPITKKPFVFHFEWDSYFETDDDETAQYLKIFHEVWSGSGEAGWLEELMWLVDKLTVCGES